MKNFDIPILILPDTQCPRRNTRSGVNNIWGFIYLERTPNHLSLPKGEAQVLRLTGNSNPNNLINVVIN